MSFPRYNPEGVGCKGGTSRTAGKVASTYEFVADEDTVFPQRRWSNGGYVTEEITLPKGKSIRKRWFNHTADELAVTAWWSEGKWNLSLAEHARPGDEVKVVMAKRIK